MKLRTTRAVVSKTMKMSNSSKLVSLITENHGLVKVMAKGARRPRSKFGAALEPITLINSIYYYRDTREIQNLSNADIIEPYTGLKSDLKILSVASGIIEIAQSQTAHEDPKAGTFYLVVDSLNGLETSSPKDAEKHLWRFVLRILDTAGYRPALDRCVMCGKKPKGKSVFFSFADGGLTCSCTDRGDKFGFMVSPGALMVMKNLMTEKIEDLPRLRIGAPQRAEIEKIILKFLAYHSGSSKPLKSLAFLRKIEADMKE